MLIKNEFQYPVMLNIYGKSCVIIGGGLVAARKLHALGKAGGKITVVAPEFCGELLQAAEIYEATLMQEAFKPQHVADAFITVAATNSIIVNRHACAAAPCLCNNVTEPNLSNFTVPSLIKEGEISVTVATSGVPAFTRLLKKYLEQQLKPAFAEFNRFLKEQRSILQHTDSTPKERTLFWRRVLNEDILKLLEAEQSAQAKEKVLDAVNSFRTQSQNSSR